MAQGHVDFLPETARIFISVLFFFIDVNYAMKFVPCAITIEKSFYDVSSKCKYFTPDVSSQCYPTYPWTP